MRRLIVMALAATLVFVARQRVQGTTSGWHASRYCHR